MEACLRYPWSVVCALLYVYLLLMIYVLSDKKPALKVLFGRTICIISLAVALLATLFLGLAGDPSMASSLPFVAAEAFLMTTIGLSVMDDIRHLSKRPLTAVLAHLGVFLVLVAAVFGRGDKEKIIVTAELDQPVAIGMDYQGRNVDMPFMITLKSFEMDVYEAEIYASSEDWDVTVEKYLDMAMPSSDDQGYRELKHTGAAPAAFVSAVNKSSGATASGWVSCGSYIIEADYLELPDGEAVYMLDPAPRKFLSKIEIYDAKGRIHSMETSVNHPAKLGSWRIYQYNYDTLKGRWSTMSGFECVRDPWYVLAWPAMIIILTSAAFAFVGRRRTRKEDEK